MKREIPDKCTVAFEDPRNHVGTITEDGQLIIDQAFSFNRRLEAAHADYCEKWEQGMDERLGNPQGNRGSDILYMFKMKAEMPEKYREDVKVQGLEPLTALLEQATQLAARDIQRRKELEARATEGDFREVEERSDGPDGPGLQKETDQK